MVVPVRVKDEQQSVLQCQCEGSNFGTGMVGMINRAIVLGLVLRRVIMKMEGG